MHGAACGGVLAEFGCGRARAKECTAHAHVSREIPLHSTSQWVLLIGVCKVDLEEAREATPCLSPFVCSDPLLQTSLPSQPLSQLPCACLVGGFWAVGGKRGKWASRSQQEGRRSCEPSGAATTHIDPVFFGLVRTMALHDAHRWTRWNDGGWESRTTKSLVSS